MISIALDLSKLVAEATRPEHAEAAKVGALPGDAVWFRYVTMHDDKVRPSHAALDGSVWRVDDPLAPVPPIDYGCRCSMAYCAAPGSAAVGILPEAEAPLKPRGQVFAEALDDEPPKPLEHWRDDATQVAKLPADERFAALQTTLRRRGLLAADAQDYARMILEAAAWEAGKEG